MANRTIGWMLAAWCWSSGSASSGFPPPRAALPAATSAADSAPTPLSEAARAILKQRCQPCHVGSSPRALPRALAIFDLDQQAWAATMKDEQLPKALGRIRGSAATKQEKRRFAAFVSEELKRRKITH